MSAAVINVSAHDARTSEAGPRGRRLVPVDAQRVEGRQAFDRWFAGAGRIVNPYPQGSPSASAFDAGVRDARQECS